MASESIAQKIRAEALLSPCILLKNSSQVNAGTGITDCRVTFLVFAENDILCNVHHHFELFMAKKVTEFR